MASRFTTVSVEELLDGTNLKYIDWQKFYDYDTPELVATYDDCAQCKATTFLTAFYIDRKTQALGCAMAQGGCWCSAVFG